MFPLSIGVLSIPAVSGGAFCLNPSSWSETITPLSVASNDGIRKSLLGMTSTDIAYVALPARNLVMMRVSGTTISQVGSALNLDYNTDTQMARLTSTKLVYINDLDDQLETVEWNEGTLSWSFVVSSFGAISGGNGFTNSIVALSENRIVMFNNSTDTFQVYESISDGPWTLIAESSTQPATYASTYSSNGLIHAIDVDRFAACGASGGDTVRIFTISGSSITQTFDTGTSFPGSNKTVASMVGNGISFALAYGLSSNSWLVTYCVDADVGTVTQQTNSYTLNAFPSEYRALTHLPDTQSFAYLGSSEEAIRVIDALA